MHFKNCGTMVTSVVIRGVNRNWFEKDFCSMNIKETG